MALNWNFWEFIELLEAKEAPTIFLQEMPTMNLYFTASGPVSVTQAAHYTALAQPKPPAEL
jgi:hypothetical protein